MGGYRQSGPFQPSPCRRKRTSVLYIHNPDAIHVLLIEDYEDARDTFAEALEELGYTVTAAADGDEAQDLRGAPDVILSDIGLPDCSGPDLLECLHGRPGWGGVPAIAISGYSDPEEIQRAREAGFARYLVKPVSIREIDRAIQDVCRAPLSRAA